jgi:hypothetical protein
MSATTSSYQTLRDRLAQTAPSLAQELKAQWEIAQTGWLPAVPTNMDSFNSAPHLRDIEAHLNATLADLHRYRPSASVLEMRPVEIYLLLAAILFHDLGRAEPKVEHGRKTQEWLVGRYESYGIRNREVAKSLARICASHTAKPSQRAALEHELRLGDVVIDPYGQVRERMIAALLTLGDHMDCAQTRVVPDYVRVRKEPIGAFRNVVRGVIADPASRLVRTTLTAEDDVSSQRLSYRVNPHAITDNSVPKLVDPKLADTYGMTKLPAMLARLLKIQKKTGDSWALNSAQRGALSRVYSTPFAPVFGSLDPSVAKNPLDQLVSLNILYSQPAGNRPWPRSTLIAVVMADLRENRAALHSIRDHLAAVGLPLATWLIDHEERLYDQNGRETYEPVLHKSYLAEVVEAMWGLSTAVFGVSEFTYEELGAALGERDIGLVRLAARRIAIVTTNYDATSGSSPRALPWANPIWVGDETWRWRTRRSVTAEARYLSRDGAKKLLDSLVDPVDAAGGPD